MAVIISRRFFYCPNFATAPFLSNRFRITGVGLKSSHYAVVCVGFNYRGKPFSVSNPLERIKTAVPSLSDTNSAVALKIFPPLSDPSIEGMG
ncbi:hypothetical protein CUROG_00555 [Corynebacterium urogenitale]|uniref:Uncharacterized protein n=1 Tax=Corynebacterium urogenitale TaxID=2487892 RepID=A0A5J6Z755_9CORY|nr:hypothetical protein CUROG_00555 [Corynebacterium urogenitale]